MLRLLHTYAVQEEFTWHDRQVGVGEEIIVTNRSEHNRNQYWGYAKDEDGNLVEVKFYEWEVYNPEDENQTVPAGSITELTTRFDETVTRSLVATAQNMPEFPEPVWLNEAELTWESRPYVNTADSILREDNE
jgi:hypothetical protein